MGRQGLGDSGKKILSVGQKELEHTHTHTHLNVGDKSVPGVMPFCGTTQEAPAKESGRTEKKKKKKTRGF